MKRLFCHFFILTLVLIVPSSLWAQAQNTFETKYAAVYYSQNKDLDDFIWRLGGNRLELSTDSELAVNRIDRLVTRVQSILDMWPENFKVNIYLERGVLQAKKVALYDIRTGSIHVSVDYASDGVVAHEIAHAVMYRYFPTPPSSKVQEILAQYVDKHLWSDY